MFKVSYLRAAFSNKLIHQQGRPGEYLLEEKPDIAVAGS